MDNQIKKLEERLNFYMDAYEDASKSLDDLIEKKSVIESEVDKESKNILEEAIPSPLETEQINLLETEFRMNLDDVVEKHEKEKEKNEKEIQALKSDSRYKEYLKLLINDDLKLCSKMEEDEVFNHLVDEKYGTDKFKNEPCFEVLKFKYQPRLWKFRKIANKKAKEFGISTFEEVYQLWNGLRINYKSLIGNKRISDVVSECEAIEEKIKLLEHAILYYLTPRREDVIYAISNRIKVSEVALDSHKFANLIPLLSKFRELFTVEQSLQERKNTIMNNINMVEKMISLAESGKINLNDKKYENFFANTNPETPIFELISDSDWNDIEKAFKAKGIKTGKKDDYSVVKTKISSKEKEDLLKKHNVKEGEIFFDPSLAGKKY